MLSPAPYDATQHYARSRARPHRENDRRGCQKLYRRECARLSVGVAHSSHVRGRIRLPSLKQKLLLLSFALLRCLDEPLREWLWDRLREKRRRIALTESRTKLHLRRQGAARFRGSSRSRSHASEPQASSLSPRISFPCSEEQR